jgi:hypothetical protein
LILLSAELRPAALQILVEHVAVDHPKAWRLEAAQRAGSAFSSERGMMNAEKEAIPLAEIFNFHDGGHDKRPAAARGAMSLGMESEGREDRETKRRKD